MGETDFQIRKSDLTNLRGGPSYQLVADNNHHTSNSRLNIRAAILKASHVAKGSIVKVIFIRKLSAWVGLKLPRSLS